MLHGSWLLRVDNSILIKDYYGVRGIKRILTVFSEAIAVSSRTVRLDAKGMTKCQKCALAALRIGLGWLFFYAGITKVLAPDWSAAGYLGVAKTFSGFYHWISSPGLLPLTNFVNEWGLTVLGILLMLGLFTRIASYLAALLMLLYYFPILQFPYPNEHSFIVDEHVVYILSFLVLAHFRAGAAYGLDGKIFNADFISRHPRLLKWL